MKALMLGACLAVGVPVIWGGASALAQPGDGYPGQPDPYYDQAPPLAQSPAQPPAARPSATPPDEDYQSDQGYGQYQPPPRPPPGEPGFQVYQSYRAYAPAEPAYPPATPQWRDNGGGRFTGRVGRAWRNPEGQLCRWRQLTWQDAYGRQAYQWVPRCRED